MKNILFYIILFLYIYITVENECENESSPSEANCNKHTKNQKYPILCCYLEPLYPKDSSSNNNQKCKTVPYSSYFKGYKKDYIDNVLYNVKCPDYNISTLVLEKCGKNSEASGLKDCKKYSTFVDSCCYFKDQYDARANNTGEERLETKRCYWLGSKYEGTINWAGAELVCYNKKLNISLFTKILFILGIVLLF